MARVTIAALQAQIATLNAELSALRTQNAALSTKLSVPSTEQPRSMRNAAVVVVDGEVLPHVVYLTRSAAFQAMQRIQAHYKALGTPRTVQYRGLSA